MKNRFTLSNIIKSSMLGRILCILSILVLGIFIVGGILQYKATHKKILITNSVFSPNPREQIALIHNGDTYVGELKNGKPNGYGTLFYNTDASQEAAFIGTFKDGLLFKGEYHRYTSQYSIGGTIDLGEYDIQISFNDGNSYAPNTDIFFQGNINGYGVLKEKKRKDMDYHGNFKDGMMDGKGVLRDAEYSIHGYYTDFYTEGYWEKGKLKEIYKEWNQQR